MLECRGPTCASPPGGVLVDYSRPCCPEADTDSQQANRKSDYSRHRPGHNARRYSENHEGKGRDEQGEPVSREANRMGRPGGRSTGSVRAGDRRYQACSKDDDADERERRARGR